MLLADLLARNYQLELRGIGKVINGTHGGFVGRLGNIVGYELNGQHIVRMTPAKRPSEKELLTCEKMTLVSQFLTSIKEVIKFGYKSLTSAASRIDSFFIRM